ncbi:MAG: hypothetical protein EAZ31_04595 [Cytophagia bacterium]|nr:MAG: hypothetical protein EAZ31_04595 [Cytophagia bacterium]
MKKIIYSIVLISALALGFSSCGSKGEDAQPQNPTPTTPTARNYTTVSIFAGSANTPPTSGNTNGTGTAALFNSPSQGVQDADGNIYVSDRGNNSIRRITPQGVVTLFAGDPNGASGTATFNGTGTNARFFQPAGLAISGGNLYVAEEGNGSVRKITISGAVVTTLATGLNVPYGIVADNQGNLFVGNYNSPRISKIVISTGVVTTFVGNSLSAHGDGTGTNTTFTNILAMCIDPQNNIYAVSGDRCVRRITPEGVVTTFAGNGTQTPAFVNSVSTASPAAFFRDLRGITIDPAGNLYVTQTNGAIRKITPQGFVTDFAGISASVFANNNNQGVQGDINGALLDARFRVPTGILCGRDNILYVFEQQRVRKIE